MGRLALTIPNLVIRRLYVERIRDALLPEYEDRETARRAAEHFYTSGDIEPLCDFIETRYFLQVFDNRDYRWTNELVIKTAFYALTGFTGILAPASQGISVSRLGTPWRRRPRSRPERETSGWMNSRVTASKSSRGSRRVSRNAATTASWAVAWSRWAVRGISTPLRWRHFATV